MGGVSRIWDETINAIKTKPNQTINKTGKEKEFIKIKREKREFTKIKKKN